MGRRGSIEVLDPRLKQAIDAALSEGRATLDEIVAMIRGMGGQVSRSAVGRYKQGFEESLTRYREAQEVAGKWVAQFQADPKSDVGRLLAEMCKTLAFQTMAAVNEDGGQVDMLELSRLARAVKALTDTDRVKAELEARLAERVKGAVDRAVAGAEAEAKDGRIPAAALKRIREEVYGVVG
jgi:hypothetical protein